MQKRGEKMRAWVVKFKCPGQSELVLTLDHVFKFKYEAQTLADKVNKQNEGIKAFVQRKDGCKD